MGFLSNVFGGGKPATTVVQSSIPKELSPYVQEALQGSQDIYKQRLEEGYVPYSGQTIAGFTPEQLQAQQGLKGLVGTTAPLQQEALGGYRGGTQQFTGDIAQQYMSPYQQAVIDAEKWEAERDFQSRIMPQFEKQAVSAGGMSGMGSRAGVQAAELGRAQMQRLGDIQTKGLQSAYLDARKGFEQQKLREKQAAGDIAQLGPQMLKSGVAEQGLLKSIGEEKQAVEEDVMKEAYSKWLEQQQFPETQLARYQSSIYGNPMLKQPNYVKTETGATPSTGRSLLGLGLYGLDMYNKAKKRHGGYLKDVSRYGGGGLRGLPVVYRQQPGMVIEDTAAIYRGDVAGNTLAELQKNEARPPISPGVDFDDPMARQTPFKKPMERVPTLDPNKPIPLSASEFIAKLQGTEDPGEVGRLIAGREFPVGSQFSKILEPLSDRQDLTQKKFDRITKFLEEQKQNKPNWGWIGSQLLKHPDKPLTTILGEDLERRIKGNKKYDTLKAEQGLNQVIQNLKDEIETKPEYIMKAIQEKILKLKQKARLTKTEELELVRLTRQLGIKVEYPKKLVVEEIKSSLGPKGAFKQDIPGLIKRSGARKPQHSLVNILRAGDVSQAEDTLEDLFGNPGFQSEVISAFSRMRATPAGKQRTVKDLTEAAIIQAAKNFKSKDTFLFGKEFERK